MAATNNIFRIYRVDGYPSSYDFLTLEEAIQFGKSELDLFSVKDMVTGNIEYSNFLAL